MPRNTSAAVLPEDAADIMVERLADVVDKLVRLEVFAVDISAAVVLAPQLVEATAVVDTCVGPVVCVADIFVADRLVGPLAELDTFAEPSVEDVAGKGRKPLAELDTSAEQLVEGVVGTIDADTFVEEPPLAVGVVDKLVRQQPEDAEDKGAGLLPLPLPVCAAGKLEPPPEDAVGTPAVRLGPAKSRRTSPGGQTMSVAANDSRPPVAPEVAASPAWYKHLCVACLWIPSAPLVQNLYPAENGH